MVGNTWEWTSSEWKPPSEPVGSHVNRTQDNARVRRKRHPQGEDAEEKQYIVKGGSFVDSRDGRFGFEARSAQRYVFQLNALYDRL